MFSPLASPAYGTITVKREIKSSVFTIFCRGGSGQGLPDTTRELKVADHIEAIERLLQLLRDLPTQFIRPGAEDLYGWNATIMRVTSPAAYMDLFRDQWEIPRPTEEQKVKFTEAIAIIEKWSEA